MSLIHDIQAATISEQTGVATLLRMCKLLAARISHEQFQQWVDLELNGYPSFDSLPDYRIVEVESYGSFLGRSGQADRLQIPVSVLPDKLQERYKHAYLDSNISIYESLISDGTKEGLIVPWPMNLAVHNGSQVMHNMQCISAWKEIPAGAVVRLLDSVKTKILGFAIDLEREAPDAGDTPIGSPPPLSNEKMTNIFNTNISGNVGNLSNAGEGFSQTTNTATVQAGNWDSFSNFFSSAGLDEAKLSQIKAELDEIGKSIDLEKKDSVDEGLIQKLSTKIASNISEVGSKVTPAVITKAITQYLGLS